MSWKGEQLALWDLAAKGPGQDESVDVNWPEGFLIRGVLRNDCTGKVGC